MKDVYRWLVFLSLTGAVGATLSLVDRNVIQPGETFWVMDWYLGVNKDVPSGEIGREVARSPLWDEVLGLDESWEKGAELFLEMAVEAEREPWNPPPAGRARSAVEPLDPRRNYWRLTVRGQNWPKLPNDAEYLLVLDGATTLVKSLPFSRLSREPLALSGDSLSFLVRRETSGFLGFFKSVGAASRMQHVAVADLAQGQEIPVVLESVHPGLGEVSLAVRLEAADVERSSDDSDRPRVIKTKSNDFVVFKSHVSILDLDATDEVIVKRGGKYTAMVLLGSRDLRPHVRCRRGDTEDEIGVFNGEVPMFAAVANAWASVRCTIQVQELDQRLEYTVVALGGQAPPVKELAIEVLGEHLARHEIGDIPVTGPQARSAAAWLVESLGAEFVPADMKLVQSEAGRSLIEYLAAGSAEGGG